MSAIYFRANLLTFPSFGDPLFLAVHLLNCLSSFQWKMPINTLIVPWPRKKILQITLLTHLSQSHVLYPSLHLATSVLTSPLHLPCIKLIQPLKSQIYSEPNNTFSSHELIFYLLITWLLGAFYNYLCNTLENAFASFGACCKWYNFDELSNDQKRFSIFCSFPLSYSYSDTICSATLHTELALFSLKT